MSKIAHNAIQLLGVSNASASEREALTKGKEDLSLNAHACTSSILSAHATKIASTSCASATDWRQAKAMM